MSAQAFELRRYDPRSWNIQRRHDDERLLVIGRVHTPRRIDLYPVAASTAEPQSLFT